MIKDRILKALRDGMPLDDVKKKYRSQSQLYEAFRVFSEEMETRLNNERENLRKVQEKLSETNDQFRSVQNDKTKVADEVLKLRQEKDHVARTLDHAKTEVRNMTKKRDQRCLEVKRLEKKGYTPRILNKLTLVDARSGRTSCHGYRPLKNMINLKGNSAA